MAWTTLSKWHPWTEGRGESELSIVGVILNFKVVFPFLSYCNGPGTEGDGGGTSI